MIEKKLTKREFETEFQKLFEADKPVIIFGAGEIGRRGVLRMEYLGIKQNIACLADNDPNKIGTFVEEIKVLSKEEMIKNYPNAKIIITVGNDKAAKEIKMDLMALGAKNFISRQALLHRFEFDGKREKALVFRDGKYILRQIVVCITERCTLKCKNCSELMPRFLNPQDLDTEEIIESIKNLMDTVTYVQDLTLLGGEPLMNKNLPVICEAVGKLKEEGKIKFANIVSNATIIPSEELLSVMKKYDIMFFFSDYGKLSINMKNAQLACENAGVQWRYAYSGGRNEVKIEYWNEVGSLEKRSLTKEALSKKFKNCNSVYDCNMIYRGRYYFCSFSAFLAGLGIMKNDNNSFDLLNWSSNRDKIVEEFHKFMEEENVIEGCYYCDMKGKVPAAEQL